MFFIPGWLIAIATFPGIVAHEIAHRFFCDLTGTPVYEICYFRRGNPAGYVIHGPPGGLGASFLISAGPLIVNTALCAVLTFSAMIPVYVLKVSDVNPVFYLLLWAGFSIGMNAFPSDRDMTNFLSLIRVSRKRGVLYYSASAFGLLVKLGNLLRPIWFDFFYALGVAWLLPLAALWASRA